MACLSEIATVTKEDRFLGRVNSIHFENRLSNMFDILS